MVARFASLRSALSDRQRYLLRLAIRTLLAPLPSRGNLERLALKHGTDKWGHGYMPYYQEVFAPLRDRELNLLEIGVGKPGNPRAGGESLRMWKEFFPAARIYGVDIEDKSYHEEARIRVFKGDQADPGFLRGIADAIGSLDIVIDDGSHVNRHVIETFRTLFPLLPTGGVYVIEDTCTSYWPQYGGNWRELGAPGTTMGMLEELLHGLNHAFIPGRELRDLDGQLTSVRFFRNIAFITRGQNEHEPSEYNRRDIERAKSLGSASDQSP